MEAGKEGGGREGKFVSFLCECVGGWQRGQSGGFRFNCSGQREPSAIVV